MFACNFLAMLPIFDRNLQLLIRAGLKYKPRKCQIFPKRINFLGHELEGGNISPDGSKLEKIRLWPFPKTGLEILSFLGLCNYYRKFIDSYGAIADPLHKQSALLPLSANVPVTE